jgi:hypothetical protein
LDFTFGLSVKNQVDKPSHFIFLDNSSFSYHYHPPY